MTCLSALQPREFQFTSEPEYFSSLMNSLEYVQNAAVEFPQSADTLKWSESRAVPSKFPGKPGLQVEPANPTEPISYFEIVFPPDIIKTIVDSTNSFALQSDSNWISTTEKEIVQLLGIYVYRNNVQVVSLLGLSKKEVSKRFGKYHVKAALSRNRIIDLSLNLRFGIEEKFCPENAACLLEPLTKELREQIATVYQPTRNLSVHNNKLEFAQSPDTPVVTVPQIFQLHDANKFVYNFLIHKSVDSTLNFKGKTVIKLLERLSGRGHSLFLKSYLTSVQLAQSLLQQKCYLTGTYEPELSANFPPEMFTTTSLPIQLQCEGVFVDKRVPLMATISTENANETSPSRKAEIPSRLVRNYRKVLRSIFFPDFRNLPFVAMEMPYSIKVFIYLLNICVQNAFVLYKGRCRSKHLKYLEFKFMLAKQLQENP